MNSLTAPMYSISGPTGFVKVMFVFFSRRPPPPSARGPVLRWAGAEGNGRSRFAAQAVRRVECVECADRATVATQLTTSRGMRDG